METIGTYEGPAALAALGDDESGCDCAAPAIFRAVRAIGDAPDLPSARQALVRCAADLLDTPWIALARPFEPGDIGFVGLSAGPVRTCARIEQRVRQGPTWDLHWQRATVICDDLWSDQRWPDYVREVTAATTVRSLVGIALQTGPETVGGLLAYADRPRYFTGRRRRGASLLADQAAIALGGVGSRVRAANLEVALATNREISLAVGIVMERCRLTDAQAFTALRQASQHRHMKLRDVAARVAVTGEIPDGTDLVS